MSLNKPSSCLRISKATSQVRCSSTVATNCVLVNALIVTHRCSMLFSLVFLIVSCGRLATYSRTPETLTSAYTPIRRIRRGRRNTARWRRYHLRLFLHLQQSFEQWPRRFCHRFSGYKGLLLRRQRVLLRRRRVYGIHPARE